MSLIASWLAPLLLTQSSINILQQTDSCPERAVVTPTQSLTREALCALAQEAADRNSDALFVSVNGQPVVDWRPVDAPEEIHVMSVTKSVAALAIGRILLEGNLDNLDMQVGQFFPEWRQGRKDSITLRHILTHTSGLQDIPNAGVEIEPAPDAVQLALTAELESAPGTEFKYNNKAVNLIAGIVQRIVERPLDQYLSETVFRDLDIVDVDWIHDPSDNPYAMAGLIISATDLAKLGQLMLNGGKWNGRPVVDSAFVARSTQSQHDLYPGHGFLWWLMMNDESESAAPAGFYGNGWLGQWLVVIPSANLVAVRLIDRSSWTGEKDSFSDFRERVRAITP
jgi:CubicO group peptidase (beta-lactamase class C family)